MVALLGAEVGVGSALVFGGASGESVVEVRVAQDSPGVRGGVGDFAVGGGGGVRGGGSDG